MLASDEVQAVMGANDECKRSNGKGLGKRCQESSRLVAFPLYFQLPAMLRTLDLEREPAPGLESIPNRC